MIQLFIRLAGALLLAMAAVNLISVGIFKPSLLVFDPLLGIPFRYSTLTVGGLELLVGLVCLFGKEAGLQVGLIAWLITNFAVYRVGLFWQGCHTLWGSLNNPLDTLYLLSGATNQGFYIILASLLLGSYVALIWLWGGKSSTPNHLKRTATESLEISCPFCGVLIKFAPQSLFQRVSCPQCQKTITLRKPTFLKMACTFCHEHIEFPSHAIGAKIPCPHCKMDITLKEPA